MTKRRRNKRSMAAAVGIPIPDRVAALIRQTLVAQLRLRLAEVITGKPNRTNGSADPSVPPEAEYY